MTQFNVDRYSTTAGENQLNCVDPTEGDISSPWSPDRRVMCLGVGTDRELIFAQHIKQVYQPNVSYHIHSSAVEHWTVTDQG